ncbi:MAG: glutamine--fructose-6-phosphate transaminase (isomerizing) [Acidimicrobiales bacterium]|nr:glutamine--fructose-6-phosphate transaminase (isomerizing) [Acidimicrobiales bacterium]
MCGIIGATGPIPVAEILIEGLERLEYRGYDSAGVALVVEGGIWRTRAAVSTVSMKSLADAIVSAPNVLDAGIGHTRWATHGAPNERNAHPHTDCTGKVAIVHNGIIENHAMLSARLIEDGHHLASDTDSEVIAHLVEENLRDGKSLTQAVLNTLKVIEGTYAIAAIRSDEPGTVVAARNVSPLIVGVSEGASYVASDIPAILGRAEKYFSVADGQVVTLKGENLQVDVVGDAPSELTPLEVSWDLDMAQKGGYESFMLKEIDEEPRAIADTLKMRGIEAIEMFDELNLDPAILRQIDKIFLVACGTSFHAAMVAKYAFEHWCKIPVELDIASEFRYRDPVVDGKTLVIGVSQSGETIDTLQALREARRLGSHAIAVANVVDSSMTREADGVLYTRAGPEIGVAATKTFVAQVAILEAFALSLAELRNTLYKSETESLMNELLTIPLKVERAIARASEYRSVAKEIGDCKDFFFLGRHVGYPTALEGALKLKEISYLHAEGFAAGELKHGPIALIDSSSVVIGVATRGRLWSKVLSNLEEVRARGARVVVIANEDDDQTALFGDYVFKVPSTHELFAPLIDIIPLQFLAYDLAKQHGNDVDRPRNLAKTVTVE